MNDDSRKVKEIKPHSPADGTGICVGDRLIRIGEDHVEDIFDYQYLTLEAELDMTFERVSGADRSNVTVHISKDPDEDCGLIFEDGLMDSYRRCTNSCIFCFIDQMPPGMRETLYFKDDDSRLSFLQGNYVTLTNMSDHDIERICRYHLSPINISVHTTDPELRCMMLGNRFAGEALKKIDILKDGGIEMNAQIVLCKGINDGEALDRTISDLAKYMPQMQSVSVVPVGLTRFRDGLYPLKPFEAEDARRVIDIINRWQDTLFNRFGTHFVHASDEWYILAGYDMPPESEYDGYPQLENGVGMVRILFDEFEDALERQRFLIKPHEELSIVTGQLMYGYICRMADRLMSLYPKLNIHVYAIRNDFFGESITVTGLITGQDIVAQLSGQPLGHRLLLPENTLRAGEDYFLDDMTLGELGEALQVQTQIVKSGGYDLLKQMTASGISVEKKKKND